MELLIEFIFELVMETSVEIAQDKKINKWIRYPIVIFISLFIILVLGLLYIGIEFLMDLDINMKLGGIVILTFDVILIISVIKKIKEMKDKK